MNPAFKNSSVVLVSGIYMPRVSMALLAYRLREAGLQVELFSHHSVRLTPAENARRLWRLIQTLSTPTVHLVGHSLGGVVIRHTLAQFQQQLPTGVTVTLGTPHQGSRVAYALQRSRLGWLLGQSRSQGLLSGLQGAAIPALPRESVLGSIAGVSQFGIGTILTSTLRPPHDGTVEVCETVCTGMRDHVCVPVGHTNLVHNQIVVKQIIHFLRHQRFDQRLGLNPTKC